MGSGSSGRDRSTDRTVGGRPTLRVIEGGAGARSVRTTPSTVIATAAVMLTLSLVILVRGVQGAPPAGDWNSLTGGGVAPASSAGGPAAAATVDGSAATYIVGVDDTWATIAAEVAPGVDPIEFARELAGVNGGYALRPGQVLILAPQF